MPSAQNARGQVAQWCGGDGGVCVCVCVRWSAHECQPHTHTQHILHASLHICARSHGFVSCGFCTVMVCSTAAAAAVHHEFVNSITTIIIDCTHRSALHSSHTEGDRCGRRDYAPEVPGCWLSDRGDPLGKRYDADSHMHALFLDTLCVCVDGANRQPNFVFIIMTSSRPQSSVQVAASYRTIFGRKCKRTVRWSSIRCRRQPIRACTRVGRATNRDTAPAAAAKWPSLVRQGVTERVTRSGKGNKTYNYIAEMSNIHIACVRPPTFHPPTMK